MNTKNLFAAFATFFLITVYFSCVNDSSAQKVETKTLLVGNWELVSATRNGRIAESMEDLFFDFQAEGKLVTNISGNREEGTWELDDNQIYQRNHSMEIDYEVLNITEMSLLLGTKISGYSFQFNLRPAKPAEEKTTEG